MTEVKQGSRHTRFSQIWDEPTGTTFWGISFLPGEFSPGDEVLVTKRNGGTKKVTVGALHHVDKGAWNKDAPNGRAYHRVARRHGSQVPSYFVSKDPATAKQLAFLKRLGGEPREGMTKREASKAIDQLKAEAAGHFPRKIDTREQEEKQARIVEVEAAERERLRANAEIEAGEAAARYAQSFGPAGSEAREAAYLAQELADYNNGIE